MHLIDPYSPQAAAVRGRLTERLAELREALETPGCDPRLADGYRGAIEECKDLWRRLSIEPPPGSPPERPSAADEAIP